MIDLPESKHALIDDRPQLVGVGIITNDLGGKHESGYKQSMARGAASSRKLGFQALQQVKGGECHRGMEMGAVKSVCNKHGESGRGHGRIGGRERREVGTCKQMGDKVSACFCDLFVPVVWVGLLESKKMY